jgi:hypothetical protein
MGMAFSCRREADYLSVTATGQLSTEDFLGVIAGIEAELSKNGHSRVLVDAREMSAPPDGMTRFQIGEVWARTFRSEVKAAFVLRPEIHNGFAETVAFNRGAYVAAFFHERDALEWLLAPLDADTKILRIRPNK